MLRKTLSEAIAEGTRALRAVPELAEHAARDSELLLIDQLGLTRVELRAHPERALEPLQWEGFQNRIARRLRCEPVQYITGHQEFFGLELQVTPAVLIPRPETELLVEQVIEQLAERLVAKILDIGTGSGAIAIALAKHLRSASITAVDISSEALAVAKANAETHGVFSSIRFLQSDLLDAIPAEERFDAIVSNPPYVPLADRHSLHPQVREYEPALALFAGDAGLDVYRRLIPASREALRPGGLLVLEMGHGQQPELSQLLNRWSTVSFHHDLQGIPRTVLARK